MATEMLDSTATTAETDSPDIQAATSAALTEEQLYRAGAYGLLASLLREIPDESVLDRLNDLSGIDSSTDELSFAMSMMGLAASKSNPVAIDDEYHNLFIGLGRGELVPYGSWYMTGFLMERPLAVLRDDLQKLGYARSVSTHEPEDHVAALSEVMSMMIREDRSHQDQKSFFNAHINCWFDRFFEDLSNAKTAVFYRSVGRFGQAFFKLERTYFSMNV